MLQKNDEDSSADKLITLADVRGVLGKLTLVADQAFTWYREPQEDAPQKEKDDYSLGMRCLREKITGRI